MRPQVGNLASKKKAKKSEEKVPRTDLPVAARVVEASPGRPYLAVRIALDPAVVGELLADGMIASYW